MELFSKLKKGISWTVSDINSKAFTLVELIIVILILAILGTIGFLSFQSYNVFARDSVRLGNLKTLESSLGIQYTFKVEITHFQDGIRKVFYEVKIGILKRDGYK